MITSRTKFGKAAPSPLLHRLGKVAAGPQMIICYPIGVTTHWLKSTTEPTLGSKKPVKPKFCRSIAMTHFLVPSYNLTEVVRPLGQGVIGPFTLLSKPLCELLVVKGI